MNFNCGMGSPTTPSFLISEVIKIIPLIANFLKWSTIYDLTL